MGRAEALLLELAQALARLDRQDRAALLDQALARLGAAYGPATPLARALLGSGRRGLTDESHALALAWAREQLRMSLAEILGAAAAAGAARGDLAPSSLAWLVLAGFEALAWEPRAAVADRVQALAAFIRAAAPPG